MPDQTEDEGLSRFAHAFGSPLTAIQGAVRMLLYLRQESSADERQLLEIIERNCRRLTITVDRLLEATQIQHDIVRIRLPLDRLPDKALQIAPPQIPEPGPGPEKLELPAGKPLILVVDDDPLARETLTDPLRQAGYAVLTAPDGTAAIDLARQYRPQLVTLDLSMPGVDGRRLLPVFKEDPDLKDIPVLIVSSNISGGHTHIPGAISALPKPIHRDIFIRTIEDILQTTEDGKPERGKLLLVDDEDDIRRPLALELTQRGYAVFELGEGSATEEAARYWEPDLILLDLRMPDAYGMDVLKQLKKDWRTNRIPVILVSVENRPDEKARGLQLGADDYVTKPFSIVELIARIEAALRRREIEFSISPSTRLPGNVTIEQVLREQIISGKPFAVCYTDLDNFKAYNDTYGFLKGDAIIHQTARMLQEAVRQQGNLEDFIGHIGGDDFVIISTPERMQNICEQVTQEFDRVIPLYYDTEARRRGYIEELDRQGRPAQFPLMTITMVIISNQQRRIEHPGQISDIAAELKKKAKALNGSTILWDQRKK
ncbi:MAG: response regulator [Chloroflexia bacterium]|nr:response regulator [Chloroflexia bacterium]